MPKSGHPHTWLLLCPVPRNSCGWVVVAQQSHQWLWHIHSHCSVVQDRAANIGVLRCIYGRERGVSAKEANHLWSIIRCGEAG
jgi:hypothetical protein